MCTRHFAARDQSFSYSVQRLALSNEMKGNQGWARGKTPAASAPARYITRYSTHAAFFFGTGTADHQDEWQKKDACQRNPSAGRVHIREPAVYPPKGLEEPTPKCLHPYTSRCTSHQNLSRAGKGRKKSKPRHVTTTSRPRTNKQAQKEREPEGKNGVR